MIKCKKVNGKTQCQVFDKTGTKPLSKPNLSRSDAQARLKQVDYFKSKRK